MLMTDILKEVGRGKRGARDLTYEEALAAAELIVNGEATSAQIGAFFMAQRIKLESVDELKAFVTVFRRHAHRSEVPGGLDCAGPYDGRTNSFIATFATSFLLAACDLPVTLHGTKSLPPKWGVTLPDLLGEMGIHAEKMEPPAAAQSAGAAGRTGAAEVVRVRPGDAAEVAGVRPAGAVEAAGVHPVGAVAATGDRPSGAVEAARVRFVPAEVWCPPLARLRPIREELGLRSILNTIEKLLDFSQSPYLVYGVYHNTVFDRMAQLVQELGYRRALIVQGTQGSEDLFIDRATRTYVVDQGTAKLHVIDPETYGLDTPLPEMNTPWSAQQQLRVTEAVLRGEAHPAFVNQVLLNGAVRLELAERVSSVEEGVYTCKALLDSGAAWEAYCLWQEAMRLTQTAAAERGQISRKA
ncbi:anthranilate phosphoribosyltransferase [Paenibacillus sp. TH7-28]